VKNFAASARPSRTDGGTFAAAARPRPAGTRICRFPGDAFRFDAFDTEFAPGSP